ncbi:M48 family metallopeptidase [Limnobacter alexandrii]|jgi:predicted metal-dependent hydrolase|uniref:M48 family metallopeptidase n=1 Tax=Limnobacter alexandrii TaxID=2570352 RepID=UPI00110A0605|nr:SprT family zinc-dependent metalloprotease [Limnobacter alexandrii]
MQLTAAPNPTEVRSIELPWGVCSYILKRSKRRSVGFLIGDQGLQISAPLRLSLTELHSIIATKASWIEQRLKQWETRSKQTVSLSSLLDAGKPVPVRGEAYHLDTLPPRCKPMLNPWTKSIALPACESAVQRDKAIEKVLRAHAKEVFTHMAAKLLERQPAAQRLPNFSIHLSSPSSRWGSCNSKREVRLNWRLVHYPPQLIEYVIAHELAHLVEMNHSARFWAVLESLMPGYQEPHKLLSKMNPAEVPVL